MLRFVGLVCVFAAHALSQSVTQADFANVQTTIFNGLHDSLDLGKYEKVGEKYYYISHDTKVNWYAAMERCRKHNGYLASLGDVSEMKELSHLISAKGFVDARSDWFWVAGTNLGNERDFIWMTSGEAMSRDLFTAGQPDYENERCTHLWYKQNTFSVNNWRCTEKAHYICQMEPKTIVIGVV